jgi:hypothetical protein
VAAHRVARQYHGRGKRQADGGPARIANTELVLWLEEEHGFDRPDAYQLLTQADGLYVGNMVDTTYSLVASIEKKYLTRS